MSDSAPSVEVVMVAPTVTESALIEWYRDQAPDASLVLRDDRDGRDSIAHLATTGLDATGWTLPDGTPWPGRSLGAAADPPAGTAWLADFERASDGHETFLQTVRSPDAIVTTLEAMLADDLLPRGDGDDTDARGRLEGDQEVLDRRHAAIAAAVPGFDAGIATAALGRASVLTIAETALTHYASWCLEGGIATPGLRRCIATRHGDLEGHSASGLLVTTRWPRATSLSLVSEVVEDTVTVAVPMVPSTPTRGAWWGTTDDLRRWIDRRSEPAASDLPVDTLVVENGSLARRPATDSTTPIAHASGAIELPADSQSIVADDPISQAIETVSSWLASGHLEGPAEACIVVSNRADARRAMRLAADGDVPMARRGRIDPFRTRVATLALAWLRIIEGVRADRGWAVVLDAAGCTWGDLQAWLDGDERPAAFASLRGDLAGLSNGLAVVASVASRYGADPRATDALFEALAADGRVPSAAAILDELAGEASPVSIEGPAPDRVTVRTDPPPSTNRAVVCVTGEHASPAPALAYAPPLGVQTTRDIVDQHGHALEVVDPNWAALAPVRSDPASRATRRAVAAIGRASEEAVVITSRERPLPVD